MPQDFNFSGSGLGVGTGGVAVAANCSASGHDFIGALELGEGNMTLACSIGSDSIAINATFVRVDLTFVIVSAGGLVRLGDGACWFITTQTPPVTGYQIECLGVYAWAP